MTRLLIRCLQVIAVTALCSTALHVDAQSSGGPYRIDKSVIAGGGGVANGSIYRFKSTLGQAVTTRINGTPFVLYGGFWAPAALSSDLIFANGFDP